MCGVLLVATVRGSNTLGNSFSNSINRIRCEFRNPRHAGVSLFPRAQGDSDWRSDWRKRVCTHCSTFITSASGPSPRRLPRMASTNSPRRRWARQWLAPWGLAPTAWTVVPSTRTLLRVRTYLAKRMPCSLSPADSGCGMRFPSVARFIFPPGSFQRCSSTAASTAVSRDTRFICPCGDSWAACWGVWASRLCRLGGVGGWAWWAAAGWCCWTMAGEIMRICRPAPKGWFGGKAGTKSWVMPQSAPVEWGVAFFTGESSVKRVTGPGTDWNGRSSMSLGW
mmetsp:Transcript_80985/g.216214  ORF Transcript_80985/g.216214 Transcript_80985/m.216214 type:complete len:280 (+) Transcript_80985:336-1175(+)